MTAKTLQQTSWLAKQLGLPVSTIERLLARGEGELPPHILVGRHTYRYDSSVVEAWLAEQQHGRIPISAAPLPRVASAPATRKNVFGKRLISASASAKD